MKVVSVVKSCEKHNLVQLRVSSCTCVSLKNTGTTSQLYTK